METREEHYESMMQAVKRYSPAADLDVIQRAFEYADEKHKKQLRKSGEPYIIHPLAVAEIVAEIGLDTTPSPRHCCTTVWRTRMRASTRSRACSAGRWPSWSRVSPS